ncbi:MAG: helix-turn-helix domain-containing protein, partial [Bacteroidota bacterium]
DEQELLTRLEQLVEENLGNEQFGVGDLSRSVGISRSHLHRRLRAATGQSVSQFIREYRLRKALDLLKEGQHTVSEVAYLVGFSSATYFSRCFAGLYGHPPSQADKVESFGKDTGPPGQGKKQWIKSIPGKRVGMLILLAFFLPNTIIFFIQLSGWNKANKVVTKSVAILPFENLSDEPSNAYFSMGVGDAIARKLAAIADVRVVSQTTMFLKGDSNVSMVEIAKKLNTFYVLKGSVQKFGDMIRVEVGLVDGKTGLWVWAENFDRKFDDIFQMQNEIAEKVALHMETTLSPEARSKLNLGYTSNPVAYELYMKAYYEFTTYTRAGYRMAQEYVAQAIELDSSFALAYSLQGNIAIAKGSMFGVELDAREALSQAIISIRKALEIEPDLPEAHAVKGFYHLYYEWDFKKAEQEYKKGIERFNTEGYALYVDYLNFAGRHKEALEMTRRLEHNEPYYPNSRMILSLFYNQQIDEAREFAHSRLRVMRNYVTMDSYGFLLLNSGEYQEAIRIFLQIFELENIRYPRILGWMGAAYARSGQHVKAREHIDELMQHRALNSAGSPAFFIAVIHAAMDETEEALYWLSVAIDDHEMEIPWLTTEPQFYQLHKHKDFRAMVNKVGFPGT